MATQPTAYPYPSTVSAHITGTLAADGNVRFVMPFKGRLASGNAAVITAPTGSSTFLTASVLNTGAAGAGTTSMGTFTFAAAAFKAAMVVSTTEAYTEFAAGDILQLKVTAVGNTVAGAGLTATLAVDQYNLDGAGSNEYSLSVRRGGHDGGVLTAANVNTYQETAPNGTVTNASAATGKTI